TGRSIATGPILAALARRRPTGECSPSCQPSSFRCSPRPPSSPARSTPFPALVGAGYATKTANVTNTVALWPGYVGGSYGYRGELRRQRRRMLLLVAPSVLGALAGSAILLSTSN